MHNLIGPTDARFQLMVTDGIMLSEQYAIGPIEATALLIRGLKHQEGRQISVLAKAALINALSAWADSPYPGQLSDEQLERYQNL